MKAKTAKNTKKYVYFFGGGKAEGKAVMKALLGGKGANLAEMTNIGLPVPPGFTITTEACDAYYKTGRKFPAGLKEQVVANLKKLEKLMGKGFGSSTNPLLVSVRSGAAASMPGMMDTVLNLGLNPSSLEGLIKLTGDARFAWDAYRRFIQMFGNVVMGVPHDAFEEILDETKKKVGAKYDTGLTAENLQEIVSHYKKAFRQHTGEEFPTDPMDQLWKGIDAVFGSWNNPRANKYRQIHDIRGLLGTAVNVQAMVFGNMGEECGTGVAFTRNPSTGENRFYGEFLLNAQGEDVVAGIRTPEHIEKLEQHDATSYKQLVKIRKLLENHYRDMQDMEFTIEKGKLYMLQTRNGKRTAAAALQIAVDMVRERLISREEAILRVQPQSLDQLLHPTFDPAAEAKATVLTSAGLPASPGGAAGQVVFNAEDAEQWAEIGKKVVLCRIETSPEDIGGMHVAEGILTARGGMTSHAAVVARQMGKCCVAGAGDVVIDYACKKLTVGAITINEGEWISLNGSTGKVYVGQVATMEAGLSGPFGILMKWADDFRRLGVRANADTPGDAERAVKFGAEGIGLCRTEHMFFEGDRIVSFRRLILVAEKVKRLSAQLEGAAGPAREAIEKELAAPLAQYNRALAELLPLQQADFDGMFRALKGRPCTIRLLDPPLHEFLPQDHAGQEEMATTMGISVNDVKTTVESLHEFNPMLGHRGCRLGITYPDVSRMQVRAIIQAALAVHKSGIKVAPEIMIPLVGKREELAVQRALTEDEVSKVMAKNKLKKLPFELKIGTMIEVPRAAVTADEIARSADFFSFGTNDLTQMGCGFSRDDAGKFLADYTRMGIYDYDPFQVLDQKGVGKLIEIACTLGRRTNPKLKLGICGEHGGEPMSVTFCHKMGLTYVSCSPYRVPIARLAAAQAAIEDKKAKKSPKKAAKKIRSRRK